MRIGMANPLGPLHRLCLVHSERPETESRSNHLANANGLFRCVQHHVVLWWLPRRPNAGTRRRRAGDFREGAAFRKAPLAVGGYAGLHVPIAPGVSS